VGLELIARSRAALWRLSNAAAVATFVFMLLTPAARAQTCRVLDPELQLSYSGPCKDGLAEGTGDASGIAHYRGGFRAGRKQGSGTKTWRSGERYEGEFEADRKHGMGRYTWASKEGVEPELYVGEYRADLRHGFGTYRWPSGDLYSGQWENDLPAGPPTAWMLQRALTAKEQEAAIARVGARVCRQLTVGIGVQEWIRGVVVDTRGSTVGVRIDDAGRFAHSLNGVALSPGTVVRDSFTQWTPCV
jgi:hypothetical protein